MGLCYLGCRDAIEATSEALEVFVEPFRTTSQTILQMCSYAGTGDVLVVQELLHIVGEKVEMPEAKVQEKLSKSQMRKEKEKRKQEWDVSIAQATAALAVGAVSIGEDTGTEMVQRVFGNIGRYGDPGKIISFSACSVEKLR